MSRVTRWLFVFSFVATLFVGLIRYPIERKIVDPSAPNQNSDYISVRGVPEFYFISDSSVAHPPATSLLLRHFASDCLAFFILFAVPVFGIELIRIAAFYAAELIRARHPNDTNVA